MAEFLPRQVSYGVRQESQAADAARGHHVQQTTLSDAGYHRSLPALICGRLVFRKTSFCTSRRAAVSHCCVRTEANIQAHPFTGGGLRVPGLRPSMATTMSGFPTLPAMWEFLLSFARRAPRTARRASRLATR